MTDVYADKPVVVVSGVPRSGTSMMMKMLEAGGVEPLTDGLRAADQHNPGGYYEHAGTLSMEGSTDYLQGAGGKAIKVVCHLLDGLPDEHSYKVLLMRRELREIVSSQETMLRADGAEPADEATLMRGYRRQVLKARDLCLTRENFEVLVVWYGDVIADPHAVAADVDVFLGWRLDRSAMAGVVDPKLYRSRC